MGYRVLGVQPLSPAAKGGLVSFFDFIISANGVPLRSLDTTFIELIKVDGLLLFFYVYAYNCLMVINVSNTQASEDKPLPLTVYNCKNHSLREVVSM